MNADGNSVEHSLILPERDRGLASCYACGNDAPERRVDPSNEVANGGRASDDNVASRLFCGTRKSAHDDREPRGVKVRTRAGTHLTAFAPEPTRALLLPLLTHLPVTS